MGIFPWSGSVGRRHNNNVDGGSNTSGGSSSILGILQSTHARLELCGIYGGAASSSITPPNHGMVTTTATPSGRMSIGVDVESLYDWTNTFSVTVCHEDVSIL
jgi:hypothetical protein